MEIICNGCGLKLNSNNLKNGTHCPECGSFDTINLGGNKVLHITLEGEKRDYSFEVAQRDIEINVGDYYIFYFAGEWNICKCDSVEQKYEINPNNHQSDCAIDFVSGFWKNCFKILNTNYDLSEVW